MIRFTVDTNILFYSVDTTDMRKHNIANRCVEVLQERVGPIPLQCLAELYQSLTRKRVLTHSQAHSLVSRFASLLPIVPARATDLRAAMTHSGAGEMQFFDALFVSTAARAGCDILLTEDMQHGRRFGAIELLNPFLLSLADLDQVLSSP